MKQLASTLRTILKVFMKAVHDRRRSITAQGHEVAPSRTKSIAMITPESETLFGVRNRQPCKTFLSSNVSTAAACMLIYAVHVPSTDAAQACSVAPGIIMQDKTWLSLVTDYARHLVSEHLICWDIGYREMQPTL